MASRGIFDSYRIKDAMFDRVRTLLPVYKSRPFGGRPRKDLRLVADAIFYRLRTGCQWQSIPVCLASGSTAVAYFQEWVKRGIFADLWQISLEIYDDLVGLDWRWQSVDGALTKATLAVESTVKNPTYRGKTGTKRSLLTEAKGTPTGLAVGGANVYDIRLLRSTLSDAQMRVRGANSGVREHVCMDNGYDSPSVRDKVQNLFDYIPLVRARGEERKSLRKSRQPAGRWVVERIHSCMNRFLAILVRWDKKIRKNIATLHLECAYITYKRDGAFA